jgi:hypothetical protein
MSFRLSDLRAETVNRRVERIDLRGLRLLARDVIGDELRRCEVSRSPEPVHLPRLAKEARRA